MAIERARVLYLMGEIKKLEGWKNDIMKFINHLTTGEGLPDRKYISGVNVVVETDDVEKSDYSPMTFLNFGLSKPSPSYPELPITKNAAVIMMGEVHKHYHQKQLIAIEELKSNGIEIPL